MRARTILAALVLPILCGAPRGAQGTGHDPRVQGAIRALVDAPDAASRERVLAGFATLGDAGRARLVRQLFLFTEGARTTRDAMVFGALVRRNAWTADDVVAPLVPLLEGADEPRRAALARVLAHYEGRGLHTPADFALYRPYLIDEADGDAEGGAGGVRDALARHMVETDPAAAVRELARGVADSARLARDAAALDRALRDAWFGAGGRDAAPGSDGRDALRALAESEHWWARLAAARAAREGVGLARVVALEALDDDEHAFVRDAARRVTRR